MMKRGKNQTDKCLSSQTKLFHWAFIFAAQDGFT
jgi:hypothetical protein